MPVLRQLVEVHHADVNTQRARDHFPLLHLACHSDCTELVEFLISAPRINVNMACGNKRAQLTPLHVACMAGSVRAVRQLLALPQIQVNAVAIEEVSSLYLACSEQKMQAVVEMLRHPAVDVNLMRVINGVLTTSPLTAAAHAGNSAMVAILLQHPAINVGAAGDHGMMGPLCRACSHGYVHVVRELLRRPDILASVGVTNLGIALCAALGIACAKQDLPVIRELLHHPGSDAILAALAVSEVEGEAEVVALLRGHRAVRARQRALRAQGGA